MARRKHIALVIETSSAYGRGLLRGVIRYTRIHDNWSVFLEQRDLTMRPPPWLENWDGDGILTRAFSPGIAEAMHRTGVPLVNLTDRHDDSPFPTIRSDDEAIGRMAAEHLLERGFQRFGTCGFTGEEWCLRREEAFAAAVKEATGQDCETFRSHWHGPDVPDWEDGQAAQAEWLSRFEKPFAVFAGNDVRGQHVVTAARELGLDLPAELAVLGVDNDELLCEASSPPLSSIRPNTEAIGYRAAEMLDALMRGEKLDEAVETVAPLDVALRGSTDVVAIGDERIAAAIHYIRENARDGISVDDVVRETGLSRSTLERQVRRHLGRTPQEEIRSVQVARVRDLLLTTDLPADRIAKLSGFKHSEYMHVVFRRLMGQTPGGFRKSRTS